MSNLRADVSRRAHAIDRLRSVTTGVVVAGVAGMIGFGVLAAATFSGKSSAQAATNDDDSPPSTDQYGSGSGTSRDQGNGNVVAPTPGSLGTAPTPRPTRTPRPHAATGGSG
jgi:hypothetical protein